MSNHCPPCNLPFAGFSSCVLACPKIDPCALLAEVFPLLQNSASFSLYSSVLQPLAEAAHMLHQSKQAVMVQLQESWFRPYQVGMSSLLRDVNLTRCCGRRPCRSALYQRGCHWHRVKGSEMQMLLQLCARVQFHCSTVRYMLFYRNNNHNLTRVGLM